MWSDLTKLFWPRGHAASREASGNPEPGTGYRRRPILLGALALVLMVVAVGLVNLATSGAGITQAEGRLQLTGQAQVQRNERQVQLVLGADATDGSGWHLDVTLAPTRQRPAAGAQNNSSTALVGQFSLNGPVSATGQATGLLNQDGGGSLTLTDDAGAASLTGSMAIDDGGNLTLDLTGQLPVVPAPASTVASAATDQAAAQSSQSNPQIFWFVSRAAGLTAYMVLFINIVLGLAVKARYLDDILARWRSYDLHQFTGLLAVGLLVLHVLALLGDQYTPFSLAQLLVPGLSDYRPLWVAVGIVAFYATLVVTFTFYVRDRIGYAAWRSIHYVSFIAFVLVLAHGLFAGTDSGQVWARVMYWSTGTIVGLLTAWRFTDGSAVAKPAAAKSSLARSGAANTRVASGVGEPSKTAGVAAARRPAK